MKRDVELTIDDEEIILLLVEEQVKIHFTHKGARALAVEILYRLEQWEDHE